MPKIRLAIADDHQVFRQGLKYALSNDSDIELVGEAVNGEELLKIALLEKPDVVLLDIKMPVLDGIGALKQLRNANSNIKVLMLTSYDEEHLVIHLLEIGANGYLLKNTEAEEIIKAVHHVYTNDFYFNDLTNNTLFKKVMHGIKGAGHVYLTDREIEIVKLICQELTTTEIANKVFLSARTVEGIRAGIMEKLGARNTAGIVVYAMKHNIF